MSLPRRPRFPVRAGVVAVTLVEPLEPRRLLSATVVVANLNDSGPGSLRAALFEAADGDTVDCTHLAGTVTLTTGLAVDKSITVVGPGSDDLTLDGNGHQAQGFVISAGHSVSISGLTITDAGFPGVSQVSDPSGGGAIVMAGDIDHPAGRLTLDGVVMSNNLGYDTGGAIALSFATLTMTNCRVTHNTATGSAGASGGGIYGSYVSLIATGCTFDHNAAVASGSTLDDHIVDSNAMGGGLCLLSAGDSVLTNCTVCANTVECSPGPVDGSPALATGGGILLAAEGDFTMTNCTVASNTCSGAHGAQTFGGGLDVFAFGAVDFDTLATLRVTNCILANNYAAVGIDALGLDVDPTSGAAVLKNDVIAVADESGLTAGVNGNVGGTRAIPLDARINTLDFNGGPTPTMSLRAGSPAIGAAAASLAPAFDQRGYPRAAITDAGAFASATNYAPYLSARVPNDAALNAAFSTTVRVADVEHDPVHIALARAPKWLSIVDHGDGTATLSGTPDEGDVGDGAFMLTLSDGHQTVTTALQVDVAAPLVALGDDGILRVFGTAAADDIHVWQPRGPGTAVRVVRDGRTWNFDASAIRSVRVYGYGGNDKLIANSAVRTAVSGGDGNDTIAGGSGPDTLFGGDGDDTIDGGDGANFVYGNAGNDRLGGGAGVDNLFGGDGRDTLDGGAGSDVYRGEAGRDVILARDGGRDRIVSGLVADGDRAQVDPKDLVSDLVTLLA